MNRVLLWGFCIIGVAAVLLVFRPAERSLPSPTEQIATALSRTQVEGQEHSEPVAARGAITKARDTIAQLAHDPASVLFRDVAAYEAFDQIFVCGEFSERSGFVGRTQFQRFIANEDGIYTIEAQDEFEGHWRLVCSERVPLP